MASQKMTTPLTYSRRGKLGKRFQHLLAVGNAHTDEHDIDYLLQYELSSHPTTLFDDYGNDEGSHKVTSGGCHGTNMPMVRIVRHIF